MSVRASSSAANPIMGPAWLGPGGIGCESSSSNTRCWQLAGGSWRVSGCNKYVGMPFSVSLRLFWKKSQKSLADLAVSLLFVIVGAAAAVVIVVVDSGGVTCCSSTRASGMLTQSSSRHVVYLCTMYLPTLTRGILFDPSVPLSTLADWTTRSSLPHGEIGIAAKSIPCSGTESAARQISSFFPLLTFMFDYLLYQDALDAHGPQENVDRNGSLPEVAGTSEMHAAS